ncbi:hypothetical protein SBBP2_580005 [Burkholderiales bacterium]|nr:hypothetical protein SBBP2_580005 [Burkholderiales bacterium]
MPSSFSTNLFGNPYQPLGLFPLIEPSHLKGFQRFHSLYSEMDGIATRGVDPTEDVAARACA